MEPERDLRLLTEWFDGKTQWKQGDIFRVCTPITNQGVTLKDPNGADHPWSRDWKGTFEKVRKVKKRNPNT